MITWNYDLTTIHDGKCRYVLIAVKENRKTRYCFRYKREFLGLLEGETPLAFCDVHHPGLEAVTLPEGMKV